MKNEKESNTNKSRYTALDLIRDLKQEIEKATGNKISDENLIISDIRNGNFR